MEEEEDSGQSLKNPTTPSLGFDGKEEEEDHQLAAEEGETEQVEVDVVVVVGGSGDEDDLVTAEGGSSHPNASMGEQEEEVESRGDEERGEQEQGITVAPRTPVLKQDPLRALTSHATAAAASTTTTTTTTGDEKAHGPPLLPSSAHGELYLDSTGRGLGVTGGNLTNTTRESRRAGRTALGQEDTAAAAPQQVQTTGVRERKKPVEADDMNGLKALMREGWWKEAARLADKLTSRSRWPHERLQLKLCLLVSLVKTRQFKKATEELESLGDLEAPSTFYESYPQLYQDKRGSMVPFTLFVLRGELPSFVGPDGLARSLDALFALLASCRAQLNRLTTVQSEVKHDDHGSTTPGTTFVDLQSSSGLSYADIDTLASLGQSPSSTTTINNSASFLDDLDKQDVLQVWRGREVRVLFSISTRYVQVGDYAAALRTLSTLLPMYPKDIVLLSAIGRLLLQWGNLVGAERYFRLVRELAQDDSSKLALVRMNQGLELVGRDRYSDALRAFELVVEVDPGNLWAANNQAVCYVYLRDLQRAISSLEQLIAANPEANISDVVIFNLCTLYDLESDNSTIKRKSLQAIIGQFAPDDFDPSIIKA